MMSMSSTGWALIGLAASLAICAPAAMLVVLRRHKDNRWRRDSDGEVETVRDPQGSAFST
jgi:hypothetical protein